MDKRILVVEDEGITSMELQRKLKFWGYEISSIAFSKKEAIKEVQNRIPDLILMDVALKGNGDGIDAAKEIKNQFDIPIIYITAYDDEKTRKRALETNPSGYMIKPVNDNELKKTIKSVLDENEQENKLIITGKWMDKNLISPDLSIISIDSNGYIKFMNKSAKDLIGKKSSLENGIDLIDVFKIRKGDNNEIPVENIINVNSSSITNNVNIVTNDGDEIPIEFITNPILEDSGEFIGAVILFRDVSDEITKESNLKLYKNLYKNSAIAIGLYNEHGKILESNDTLMRLFSVSDKSDLDSMHILPPSKLNPENVTRYKLRFNLKGFKKLNSYETTPSGIIYLKAILTPLVNNTKDSDVVYILQLQDITLQHLKEESLNERREDNLKLQRNIEDLNDIIRNQQIDWEKLNNKLNNLKNEIELNRTSFSDKEKELTQKIQSQEESNSRLQEIHDNIQEDVKNLEDELSQTKADLETKNQKYIELKNSSQELINNLEKENQTMKNNITIIEEKLSAEIVKNKEREKELQDAIVRLNENIKEKTTELENIKVSSQVEIDKNKQIAVEKEDIINEKELLLRNFQKQFKKDIKMISGLSGLQSEYYRDQMINSFREGQNMIKSLLSLHEKLYETDDFEKINFKEYIDKIVNDLALSYNIDTSKINVKILVNDLCLDMDKTAVTGLIINELVSNSFKYAFTPGKTGELAVHIWEENQELIMDISDNGIGLPDNIDINSTDTLGLQLIRMLVNQIDGSIKYIKDDGAHFVINFPKLI